MFIYLPVFWVLDIGHRTVPVGERFFDEQSPYNQLWCNFSVFQIGTSCNSQHWRWQRFYILSKWSLVSLQVILLLNFGQLSLSLLWTDQFDRGSGTAVWTVDLVANAQSAHINQLWFDRYHPMFYLSLLSYVEHEIMPHSTSTIHDGHRQSILGTNLSHVVVNVSGCK